MKKNIFFIILFFSLPTLFPQHIIKGNFPLLVNQYITLKGFSDFDTYTVDSVKIDEKGNFLLTYSPKDFGMGYLSTDNKKNFSLVLNGEIIELKGDDLAFTESIEIVQGDENKLYALYIGEHIRREQALSAWVYLEKIYNADSLFLVQLEPKNAIKREKLRIKQEDNDFLLHLDENSFLYWYLPLRKLISSVSIVAQYRTDEIPATIEAFRKIDYLNPKLKHSGFLSDIIEAHFWLIENSGRTLDSVYAEMARSIDIMQENLVENENQFDQVYKFLFKLLEKRSLYPSAEYLALKILDEKRCHVDPVFLKELEGYRSLKVGKIVPNIEFKNNISFPKDTSQKLPKKLSDLKSNFVLLVFGASWSPESVSELSSITGYYSSWKKQDLEVVFISLDEQREVFKNFSSIFPFLTFCDYKKWESSTVKDYFIYTIPTFFLLNNKREIILKPSSAFQVNAWVDWYLIQGNLKMD